MDCRIRVWDIATSKVTTEIDAGPVETWTATFSPSNAHLASGAQSGNINIWSVESGSKLGCIETHGKFVMAVRYVRRGLSVGFAHARSQRAHFGVVCGGVAQSPDGKRIACGAHDGVVSIWDLETSTLLDKLDCTWLGT